MIKLVQGDLDCVEVCDIVVFGEMDSPKHPYLKSYPIISAFDGVVCDFEFPEGGSWCTYIPISTGKYKAVTITIMDGWVEYKITDDWGKVHYLYIRTSESEIIFKSILNYKEKYSIIPVLK